MPEMNWYFSDCLGNWHWQAGKDKKKKMPNEGQFGLYGSLSEHEHSVLFSPSVIPVLRAEVHLCAQWLWPWLSNISRRVHSSTVTVCHLMVCAEHIGTARVLEKQMLAWVCFLSHTLRPLLTHLQVPSEWLHREDSQETGAKAREILAKIWENAFSWLRVSQNRKSQMVQYLHSIIPRAPLS